MCRFLKKATKSQGAREQGDHCFPAGALIQQGSSGNNPAIELCVVVEVVLDDVIALASPALKPCSIQDLDDSSGVVNQAFFLESGSSSRHRRA